MQNKIVVKSNFEETSSSSVANKMAAVRQEKAANKRQKGSLHRPEHKNKMAAMRQDKVTQI
jgi:hypothetical protein